MLSPYVTPSATRWHTSSDSVKPYEANSEKKVLGCWALLLTAAGQLSSANTTETIGELFTQ